MDTVTITVAVGWTSVRPIQPDQHTTHVTLVLDCAGMDDLPRVEAEARLLASTIVASTPGSLVRPACVMPTRAEIVALVL